MQFLFPINDLVKEVLHQIKAITENSYLVQEKYISEDHLQRHILYNVH